MWNRAALLAAALAFALPATADNPSKLIHKNSHAPTPKNLAPTKSPRLLNSPSFGSNANQQPKEATSFEYGQLNFRPQSGKSTSSGSTSGALSTLPNSKVPSGNQGNKGSGSIAPATTVPLKNQPSIPPPKSTSSAAAAGRQQFGNLGIKKYLDTSSTPSLSNSVPGATVPAVPASNLPSVSPPK